MSSSIIWKLHVEVTGDVLRICQCYLACKCDIMGPYMMSDTLCSCSYEWSKRYYKEKQASWIPKNWRDRMFYREGPNTFITSKAQSESPKCQHTHLLLSGSEGILIVNLHREAKNEFNGSTAWRTPQACIINTWQKRSSNLEVKYHSSSFKRDQKYKAGSGCISKSS